MDVLLPAEPEPINLELERTAVLVVDMQNAFASLGGMLDLAGVDVRPAHDAVANAALVLDAARATGGWSAGIRLKIRRLAWRERLLRGRFEKVALTEVVRCEELTNFLTNMAGEVAHRFLHSEPRSAVRG